MGQIISIVLFIVVIGFALASFAEHPKTLSVATSAQSASVITGVDEFLQDFNETGTLSFYPNNVGPVPYLFYQDGNGTTVAKALVFPNSSPTNFSSWSGAHVSVIGERNGEHVIVDRITYISPP